MKMNEMGDASITKIVKLVYEVNGEQFEAYPATRDEIEKAKIGGISLEDCDGEPCSGDRICVDNRYWRCIYDASVHGCSWFVTSERC